MSHLRLWRFVEAEAKGLRSEVKGILLEMNDQRRYGEIAQMAVFGIGHISQTCHQCGLDGKRYRRTSGTCEQVGKVLDVVVKKVG